MENWVLSVVFSSVNGLIFIILNNIYSRLKDTDKKFIEVLKNTKTDIKELRKEQDAQSEKNSIKIEELQKTVRFVSECKDIHKKCESEFNNKLIDLKVSFGELCKTVKDMNLNLSKLVEREKQKEKWHKETGGYLDMLEKIKTSVENIHKK